MVLPQIEIYRNYEKKFLPQIEIQSVQYVCSTNSITSKEHVTKITYGNIMRMIATINHTGNDCMLPQVCAEDASKV